MAWYSPLVGTSVNQLLAKLTNASIVGFVDYEGFLSFSLFPVHIPEVFKYVQYLFKSVMGAAMEARKNLFLK